MKQGFFMTGILPAKYPDELVVANQPESVATGIGFFDGSSGWETRQQYLPEDYKEILDEIIVTKGGPRNITPASGPMPSPIHIPAETAEGRHGSEFTEVPVNWPESLNIINKLREDGYLLAGILPGLFKNADNVAYDNLIMYRPPTHVNLDFDAIHVVPNLAPLHDFMRKEYLRRSTNKAQPF